MMEDPTQLLSGTVASYLIDQLARGKSLGAIPIPGFTGVSYPLPRARADYHLV